ncbi:MAG: copper chaperone [Chitinophagaceae bacterium]|nr:copper chaperone [Chitinophagaceae bacterium]
MKKTLLLLLIAVGISLASHAQQPKPQWVTIKSPNLKCWECKERLEKYLVVENKSNMESGMMQWKINLLQGEIKVQYLPDRINPEVIRTAMNNAGFDADDSKADEESYKKLPQACKRAADGGGPQKGKPCHVPPVSY